MNLSKEQALKIKKLYELYCYNERLKPYEEYNADVIQAIQQVLNILNLKIEGVNT